MDDPTLIIWYGLLKDLSDRTYMGAIEKICKNTSNIYPGTNIVALILETAEKVRNEAPPTRLQLEEGYTPEQFEEGKRKLRLILNKLR